MSYRLRIDRSGGSATPLLNLLIGGGRAAGYGLGMPWDRGGHSQMGTHHCQPSGAGSQLGSGRHPGGGVQPAGGEGQVGGTAKRMPLGGGGMGA